jgi:hypothetical protein
MLLTCMLQANEKGDGASVCASGRSGAGRGEISMVKIVNSLYAKASVTHVSCTAGDLLMSDAVVQDIDGTTDTV